MDAQIRHGTHGSPVFVEEPGIQAGVHGPGLGAAMTEGGAEGDDVADEAVRNQRSCHAVSLGKPLVVADHQEFAVFVRCLHHGLALRQGDGHRLFAQDILACVEGGDGQLRMGEVGSADGYCLNLRIFQQLLYRSVGGAAVLLSQRGSTLLVDVVKAQQLCFGVVCVLRDVANLGNLAAADDTDSKHGDFLPYISCCPSSAAAPRR